MERIIKLRVWLLLLLLLLLLPLLMLFGNAALHVAYGAHSYGAFGKFAFEFFFFLDRAQRLFTRGLEWGPKGNLVEKNTYILRAKKGQLGFVLRQNTAEDAYLLISAYSKEHKTSIVSLFSIKEKKILRQWVPNFLQIHSKNAKLAKIPKKNWQGYDVKNRFRSHSPLLLEDGSVVVHSGHGALYRISACQQVLWSNAEVFHHALEKSLDGNILAILNGKAASNERWRNESGQKKRAAKWINDGYAIISAEDGTILRQETIYDIFLKNELDFLIETVKGNDPIHLNDVEFIEKSDAFVQKGDMLFSLRHLSMVFLYRPSSGKILWYKQGPWSMQHDMDYQGHGVFSLLGNDYGRISNAFLYGHSSIYFYKPSTGSIARKYQNFMKDIRMPTQGKHRILRNGDLFLEDSVKGMLYRIDAKTGQALWSFSYKLSETEIGAMHWSRYLYKDEVDLSWLGKTRCM